MDDLLEYGVGRLGGMLKENSNTRTAFRPLAKVVTEFSEFIVKENKGIAKSFFRKVYWPTQIDIGSYPVFR